MKTKILSILALLLTVTQGAWAQVGRVLATDGKYYKTVTAATNAGTTASGMIVYWGDGDTSDNTYNQGLVIKLSDVANNVKWGEQQDVTGITNTGQNAASSMVDLRGIANTDAIVSKWPTGTYPYAADHCRASIKTARPSSSSNWFLPSQGQFVLMMNSYGAGYGTSTSYAYDITTKGAVVTAINNALTNAGGTALSNGRYWTSTEVNQDVAADWSASNSSFGFNDKTAGHYVRAMFAFSGATAAEYTVSYNANGGSGAPSAQTKDGGIDLTLSSTVPTRDGYTFAGWNTQADGNGTPYAAGATYSANAAVTLYAQWTENTATLTDGDDLSALSAWAGKTCTVTYTRSFTAGKPSTVCLPFAYTPQGEEKFYSFTGINEDDGNYTAYMTEVVSPLVANTPYLFMPTGDADFSGTYAIPSTIAAGTTTSGDWTFKGTYSTIGWTSAPVKPTYGFSAQDANDGITQGQFVKVGSYVRIKPMRAYLEYNGSDSQFTNARSLTRAAATTSDDTLPETIGVRLISANGEVTAIGTLYTRTGEVSFDSEAWYTLDGKRLNAKPNTKGIYVNNGKKVVIK